MASANRKIIHPDHLCLDIVGIVGHGRFKGFHEVSIIKHQIGLYDTITVEDSDATRIHCSHPAVPLDNTNICWKALDVVKTPFISTRTRLFPLRKTFPFSEAWPAKRQWRIHVEIAHTLWNLDLSTKELIELGRRWAWMYHIILGNTAFDSESTGILEPIQTALGFDFVLVIPGFRRFNEGSL